MTLLLNHVVLAAGDAMFIPAGMIHAYTSGFGVEIMASSDNVLRAGLTPKHVDVTELLRITDFGPTAPPRWAPTGAGVFAPPVAEFELEVLERGIADTSAGPAVVLCLDGRVAVRSGTRLERLSQGGSVYIGPNSATVDSSGGRAAIGRLPTH